MIGLCSVWVENREVGFYGILVHHREYNPPLRLAEEMIGLCSVWVENRWVGFYGIPVHLTVSTTIHFNAFQNRLLFWVVFKIVGLGSTEFWYISSWPHHSRRWVQESMALLVWVWNRAIGFYGIPVHLTVSTTHHFCTFKNRLLFWVRFVCWIVRNSGTCHHNHSFESITHLPNWNLTCLQVLPVGIPTSCPGILSNRIDGFHPQPTVSSRLSTEEPTEPKLWNTILLSRNSIKSNGRLPSPTNSIFQT